MPNARLPRISIVIPSYNKVNYVGETLQSLVCQKYPNLEVIIQDGGSKDGTLDVIKQYTKRYPGIFKYFSKRDKGQVDAINKGFRKAKGNVLAYLNADDILKEGALLAIGKVFAKDPQLLWLTGYGDIIDQNGGRIASLVTVYKNILLGANNYKLLLMVNYITQPATFLSRKTYLLYGPFKGTEKYVTEYDLWLKLGRINMPYVIDRYLASFRLTTDNISATEFRELLSLDYKIASTYTSNRMVLALHYLNNLFRTALVSLLKRHGENTSL